ncbi:hypothetical protein AOZ06_40090 [Kibdelosporangium phytohabitans]|uniref:Uncharacterized protein n=1 Tax=Kibdelosporangium phytohabitans TaxID=860235 RepID=A0A0N9ICC9_9PSEU|nr:hypothetical protein AOZ06_40090 [Kibdelosporangium phytohabitans]
MFTGLETWMPDFWRALDAQERGLSEARVLTEHLHLVAKSFAAVPRLRPWRELYRYIDDMVDGLVGVWRASLDAFGAPSMLDAERAQRALQTQIDRVDAAYDKWKAATDRQAVMAGMSPEDQIVASTAAGMADADNSESVVRSMLVRNGVSTSLPPGIGEFMRVCVDIATVVGERESLGDLISATVAALRADLLRCRDMMESEVFQSSFSRALGEMYRSGNMLHVLAVAFGDERIAVDAMVAAAHSIVESSTRHPVALIAASLAGTGYRAALEAGANKCVLRLRASAHSGLVADLDLDLRNAQAHRGYRITEEHGVDILNDRGNLKKHVTAAELVDIVVAGNLLALAMTLGVVLFACDTGVDVMPMLESDSTLPEIQSMQFTALIFGWPRSDVSVSSDRTEIHFHTVPPIKVTLDATQARNLTTALTLATRAPTGIERLVFHDETGPPLVVDVQSARATTGVEDSFDQILAYMAFFHLVRRGGERALNADEWHRLVLANAQKAAAQRDGAGLRKLINLRSVVRGCEDTTSIDALNAAINALRAEISGGLSTDPTTVLFDISAIQYRVHSNDIARLFDGTS